jgi:hypothetical protein
LAAFVVVTVSEAMSTGCPVDVSTVPESPPPFPAPPPPLPLTVESRRT